MREECYQVASSWLWHCISMILALGKLGQEGHEFKASLGYMVTHLLKKQTPKTFRYFKNYCIKYHNLYTMPNSQSI